MDRRRAAGALLALAACIATSAAAPTANNHTALDLYEEPAEGCYYNFQHYGEGDRIMTNEPCLNCTCHNRMLMCYLRVCPFTKAIGQDCTVEKRADQCCPIVTCPDVPVDLLTSTSTSSPAEYGGTGVGKVDKYGCSINGKYFPEGAKVPPSPGKPCEHCYCIRNMTTCVMQECTLHVDGCTPIYHKDVCCPVRYFCDHPEDEVPLLDDMTTTVRPTPGFLLTTTPPTEAPETTTLSARRDCIENDQLYPDGALIKTDKPCEHCYCMKGDIVCVVQECGTPMENEGKNCTSVPPRDGQCCPDTYICEGDEQGTETPSEEPMTTIVPPRRVSVEGSGYRIDDMTDKTPYTEIPTFASELEGSGEAEPMEEPQKGTTQNDLLNKFGPDQNEFIPLSTQAPIIDESEIATTEPDKGLNTVPSGLEEELTEPSLEEKTTMRNILTSTESPKQEELATTARSALDEETTSTYELKSTKLPLMEEQTTVSSIEAEGQTTAVPKEEISAENITKPSLVSETDTESTEKPESETIAAISHAEEPLPTETTKFTDMQSINEQDIALTEASLIPMLPSDEIKPTVAPRTEETAKVPETDSRRTTQNIDFSTPKTVEEEEKTESSISEQTIHQDSIDVTESSVSEPNTVTIKAEDKYSSESPQPEITTISEETKGTELPSTEKPLEPIPYDESSEPATTKPTTSSSDAEKPTQPEDASTTVLSKEEETVITTEPTFKKEEEVSTPEESVVDLELSTVSSIESTKESAESIDKMASTDRISTIEPERNPTTDQLPKEQEQESTYVKESTTESMMEISTFVHISDKDTTTTILTENEEISTVAAPEKTDLSESSTINPAENEIAEVPAPGRIPGEGDCLLEGTTYKNNSFVPSTNNCHTGCKCVSSIIKCDPIICSPPPEDMDNCQPRYDTPEACCPTYICDHGMETIPPQPQSHITGTESPTPSSIDCHGDTCEKVDVRPSELPHTPDTVETSECGSAGCDQTAQNPAESCDNGKCEVPPVPTETEQPHKVPTNELPQPCANPEDCKEIKIPEPCQGESCTTVQSDQCDTDGGCVIKPDAVSQQEPAQVCNSAEECKQVKIPSPESTPCEGESCTKIQEDCSGDECKIITPAQPSQDGAICSEESGCQEPEIPAQCKNGECEEKEIDRTGCYGEDCMQQEPLSPTQETIYFRPVSTPSVEETTPRQPSVEEELQPTTTELLSTLSKEVVTTEPTVIEETDKEIQEIETSTLNEDQKDTIIPVETVTSHASGMTSEPSIKEDTEQKTTEPSIGEGTSIVVPVTENEQEFTTVANKIYDIEGTEISSAETTSETEKEAEPTEENMDKQEGVSEPQDIQPEKTTVTIEEEPEKSTEVMQQYDDTKTSESPEIEQESTVHVPVSPEVDSFKPEEPLTDTPGPELVTVKAQEESINLPDSGVTEPSIQGEFLVTELPKLSTISEESNAYTGVPSKSPDSHEEEVTTPLYETEPPAVDTNELPEVFTKGLKEGGEQVTTLTPERSGPEDQSEPTIKPSDVSQVDITQPENGGKDSTTEASSYTTASVENITSEKEDTPYPYVESQTTLSPEKVEIVTPSEQSESELPVRIDDQNRVSEMPDISVAEEEKQTESPLSLVTTQPQGDITTKITTESEEVVESTSPVSELYEPEEGIKTSAPEIHVTTSTDSSSLAKEPELFTEKTHEDMPVTEPQQIPVSTETRAPTSQKEELPITNTPPTLGTDAPANDEQGIITQEPEIPEIEDETTKSPVQSPTTEKEGLKETESQEPAITEDDVISTKEPESIEDGEQHVTVSEGVSMQPQEAVTKEPESDMKETDEPTEITEEADKVKTTEKPTSEEATETAETIANIEPELPGQDAEDRGTTESPILEHEKTQTPAEFVTKETFTVSPQLYETTEFEIEEKFTTISSKIEKTEPPITITELPVEEDTKSKLPQEEPVTEHETDQALGTDIPVSPPEEALTKLPEIIATSQPELASSDSTEGSTLSPSIQEEDQTGQTVTESIETTVGPDRAAPEEESTETVREELEATTPSFVSSSLAPNSEQDEQRLPDEPLQTSRPEFEHSETTPYLVELEEHTHKMDEEFATVAPSDETSHSSSEETTELPYEEPTAGPSEKSTTSPSVETTVAASEEPALISSDVPAISLSEPTMIPQEESAVDMTEGPTTSRSETHVEPQLIENTPDNLHTDEQSSELPEVNTTDPSVQKEEIPAGTKEPPSTESVTEKSTEYVPIEESSEHTIPMNSLFDKFGNPDENKEKETSLSTSKPEDYMTQGPSIETEKPVSVEETEKDVTVKPQHAPVETTAPEEEFIPVTAKTTTVKAEEEAHTQPPTTTPEEKPAELSPSTSAPEISKPDELLPTDEVPLPEEESHFPPSGGYNQEPDYVEEDQAFGPGTCRYGGKVYVSAQQIPRDDPCDFCFCFRSDIICLQQSCPPPIHGCHEEPIQGFCCPRYECPVSMATTLNVTTTTTTTTTTLPPHFLPHAYKGAATRKGCQIKGHTYQVGEVVRASSGPCLHCTCGGDGQMKCDPKQCTPEPMLRQMIAAAVSAKRRR
ncbi:hypothetical protein O0L34_g7090 [Tuta absoluta]|nr:hypothetical protein O0L34_g7090 [Tuta absoluta]